MRMRIHVLGLVAALVLGGAATASAPARLEGGDALVTVRGTSTLHDWEASTKDVRGFVEIEPSFVAGTPVGDLGSLRGGTPPVVRVTVPARALQSGKERMDRLMHEALAADRAPEIRFELTAADLAGAPDAKGGFGLHARGRLTVAGTTRPVEMTLRVERPSRERIVVTGTLPLRMSDFGITPPTAVMGTIKTGDEVTVTLQWTAASPRS